MPDRTELTYDHWPYHPPPQLDQWEWLHDRGVLVLYTYPKILVPIGEDDTGMILSLQSKLWKGYAIHPDLEDYLAFTAIGRMSPLELLQLLRQPLSFSQP